VRNNVRRKREAIRVKKEENDDQYKNIRKNLLVGIHKIKQNVANISSLSTIF
jgi:hypothetical protein